MPDYFSKRLLLWGWLRMLLGVTAYPEEVYYQCEKCEEIIDRTTDIEVRRLHV